MIALSRTLSPALALGLALACLSGGRPAFAQSGLVIQSFPGNGTLGWTHPTNNVAHFRVEWAPAAEGPWRSFEDAAALLHRIAPTGDSMAVQVPMFYRLAYVPRSVEGQVLIPQGTFSMGDTFNEGFTDERPVHSVTVSEFYLDAIEVSFGHWVEVRDWALANGYTFLQAGAGRGANHPVHSLTWIDAVRWCNARSEKAGLRPCYYTDAGLTTVYRSAVTPPHVDWAASGYRLPTEAEWQRAARGGQIARRFPWGNTITHAEANYLSITGLSYDVSPSRGFHPAHGTGGTVYTSPVGSFAPNEFGLYDVTGNVLEWCWDWYAPDYYANSPAIDPRGPGPGDGTRLMLGGSWSDTADSLRLAYRNFEFPSYHQTNLGLRCARRP
jgi:formylglycine-generating enzyme required for sulfatase activity